MHIHFKHLYIIWLLTKRLKESLNFWKMSTNSRSGGGLARMDKRPSPMSFFFDLRDLKQYEVWMSHLCSKTWHSNIIQKTFPFTL